MGETLKTLAPLAHGKGLELAYDVRPDVPEGLLGDAGRLGQIVVNLVGNAIKFAEHGEVAVHVDAEAHDDEVLHAMLTSWRMRPVVVENAPSALAAIEHAQAQGQPFRVLILDAHMPDVDGFGLLEQIGDRALAGVTVMLLTSDLNRGDLVRCRELGVMRTLMKPITPSELREAILLALGRSGEIGAGAGAGESRGTTAPSRQLHVMVAEDNRVNQMLIVRLLEKQHHTVVAVGNGKEAVRAVEAEPFDPALMDIQMPEMDGLAATAAIRAREARDPGLRHLPIVALTAFAMNGDREKCLAAGMDDYLSKPVKYEELCAVLGRVLVPNDV